MDIKKTRVHTIDADDEPMSSPKPKRTRGQFDASEAPWKSAIAALSTCVSREECIQALSTSFRIFNHTNQQVHDEEIASKADAVLCRLLSFLVLKETFDRQEREAEQAGSASIEARAAQMSLMDNEIACTCQITEMVYRCSKEVIETSFQRLGQDFLNLFASILTHQLPKYRAPSDQESDSSEAPSADVMKPANVSVRSVSKVLCHYARIQSATMSMAQHPRLLSLMISLLQHPIGVIPFEAHHNFLWVLANMACCNENMQYMVSHDSLLDTVIHATCIIQEIDEARPIRHQALRLQHSAFRCLLNLSWDEGNKVLMSQRDDLVNSIKKTVEARTVPNDTRNSFGTVLLQTRLFAMGTLRNIAHSPPPQQHRLCTAQDGMVLNLLCDATQSDEEPTIRDKAFAVVFNLVSAETAEVLISHPRLLHCLVEAASVPATATPQGTAATEGSSAMSLRSLNALEQALPPSLSEECRLKFSRATEQVAMARRFHDMAVPLES